MHPAMNLVLLMVDNVVGWRLGPDQDNRRDQEGSLMSWRRDKESFGFIDSIWLGVSLLDARS